MTSVVTIDEANADVVYTSIYLSKAEKEVLADCGEAFIITAITLDEANPFGPRWVLTIKLDDEAAESVISAGVERKLGLNCNGHRDAQFSVLAGIVADGKKVIGPVVLTRKPLRNGTSTWDLVSATSQSAIPGENIDPDDVPF
jgi:hypothetical protein